MKLSLFLILALALGCAIASSARATEIDFTKPITQLDGKPLLDAAGKPVDTTLAMVAETALLASYQDEQNLSADDKIKRFGIAKKISDAAANQLQAHGKVELSVEELAMLKKLIAKAYNPLITGRAFEILDPASMPK
jgi:hypothetical protein